MRAIVNVNEEWGIGSDGDLLVYIPEDMKYFRSKTAGAAVIMGRKTLDSFPGGKPLKGRLNIVLTSDTARISSGSIEAADYYFPDIKEAGSRQRLLKLAEEIFANRQTPASERATVLAAVNSVEEAVRLCAGFDSENVYVIGGASVYKSMLPYCSECLVTFNDSHRAADSYFPDLCGVGGWKRSVLGEMHEYEDIHYHFDVFERE